MKKLLNHKLIPMLDKNIANFQYNKVDIGVSHYEF